MRTGTRFLLALAAPLCFGGLLLAQHTGESDTNPLAGNGAAIAAGSRLYDSACQSCHGAGARGDRGPALAAGVFRHGNADGQIFLDIRNGIDGTAMPAFSQFTADQVWQLVSFIRSLAGTVVASERAGGDLAAGMLGSQIQAVRSPPTIQRHSPSEPTARPALTRFSCRLEASVAVSNK